jgi:hypothetical protein
METDLCQLAEGASVATPYGRRSSGSSAAPQCSIGSEVDSPFLKHPKGLGSWHRLNERLSVWCRGWDGASMSIASEGRRHMKSREGIEDGTEANARTTEIDAMQRRAVRREVER